MTQACGIVKRVYAFGVWALMVSMSFWAISSYASWVDCYNGTCYEAPVDWKGSGESGYYAFEKSIVCEECYWNEDWSTMPRLKNNGCKAKISKTDSNGFTSFTFTYLDSSGRKQTIKYKWQDLEQTGEFVYDGHVCSFWWDFSPPFFVTLYVDGVEYVYVLKPNSSSGVSVPFEWQKARTLNGVATRAMPHPYVGTFTVKCGKANKNGAAKVSAVYTPFSGKKTTYKAQTVDVTGGAAKVSWNGLEVTIDGDEFRGGDGLDGGLSVGSANIGGSWGGATATVSVYADDVSMFSDEVLTDLLPGGEQATANNGKWTFAKSASVKWAKPKNGEALPGIYDEESGKGLIIDTTKGKTNLSGLKLSYASKDGTFNGKFQVYALEGEGKSTKLKKYSVSVTGIVVGGKGYGRATCKNPAVSWTVLVE